MNLKILIFIALNFFTAELYSQTFQWNLLPNSPGNTGNSRNEDIYFIDPNTGWVVGYKGNVDKTTNGGNSWVRIFDSTFGDQLRSVGFFDSSTGLIGTLIEDSNKVLYRTSDGGFNWTAVSSISGKRPQGICGISIVNENIAYACGRYYGSARVIKTTNKGASWNLVFSDSLKAKTLIDIYFWTPDSGIAVGGSSSDLTGNAVVIKTTDGGNSWLQVHKTTRMPEWCWKISFISRDIGFVSIERFSGLSYILKTTNNGNNWTEIAFRDYNQEGIGFVNENTGWVGGWTGPTYQTTNGGANWQLAGWGTNVNRFRFLSDTLAYAVGDRVYKYTRVSVGVHTISGEIPNSFRLYQNYPNPFNPVTTIRYSLAEYSFISLKVYNALGMEMQVLVNQGSPAGNYEAEFSSNDLPSGLYFYKLEAGRFKETKQMILLK